MTFPAGWEVARAEGRRPGRASGRGVRGPLRAWSRHRGRRRQRQPGSAPGVRGSKRGSSSPRSRPSWDPRRTVDSTCSVSRGRRGSAHAPRLRALLETLPMGTSSARDRLVAGLRELDLAVESLPLWVDVDVAADLPLAQRLIGGGARAWRLPAPTPLRVPARHAPLHRRVPTLLRSRQRAGVTNSPRTPGWTWSLRPSPWGPPASRSSVATRSCGTICSDLIGTITGVHGARVRLFFNRALDEAGVASLAAAGHGLLTPLISLDGDEDTHDLLRGRGSFRAASATARRLAEAGSETRGQHRPPATRPGGTPPPAGVHSATWG